MDVFLQHLGRPCVAGLNPGLVDVAGVPLVNYWLLALRSCPRLLPASQKVHMPALGGQFRIAAEYPNGTLQLEIQGLLSSGSPCSHPLVTLFHHAGVHRDQP
jgi:hypothetical protein